MLLFHFLRPIPVFLKAPLHLFHFLSVFHRPLHPYPNTSLPLNSQFSFHMRSSPSQLSSPVLLSLASHSRLTRVSLASHFWLVVVLSFSFSSSKSTIFDCISPDQSPSRRSVMVLHQPRARGHSLTPAPLKTHTATTHAITERPNRISTFPLHLPPFTARHETFKPTHLHKHLSFDLSYTFSKQQAPLKDLRDGTFQP